MYWTKKRRLRTRGRRATRTHLDLGNVSRMDKRITKYDSLEAMRAAEYREWHRLPPRERIRAVMDISVATYAMKGRALDVPRLQRTLVRVQRPAR